MGPKVSYSLRLRRAAGFLHLLLVHPLGTTSLDGRRLCDAPPVRPAALVARCGVESAFLKGPVCHTRMATQNREGLSIMASRLFRRLDDDLVEEVCPPAFASCSPAMQPTVGSGFDPRRAAGCSGAGPRPVAALVAPLSLRPEPLLLAAVAADCPVRHRC